MRWKLIALLLVTIACIFAVMPFRTHAVRYDPANPPEPWSLGHMLANMYVTPTALLLIFLILAVAAFVASKVVRGDW